VTSEVSRSSTELMGRIGFLGEPLRFFRRTTPTPPPGFDPGTLRLTAARSNQLSYGGMICFFERFSPLYPVPGSNRWPQDQKSCALPTELTGLYFMLYMIQIGSL
jgi:hypothetical protein